MVEFKNKLLDYLRAERRIANEEIAKHRQMPDEEKEAAGLMIRHASIDINDDEVESDEYRFRFEINETKIRLGDYVRLICENTDKAVNKTAIVHEVSEDYIIINIPDVVLDEESLWSIEVFEVSLFDSYIKVLEEVTEGMPGSFFLEQLAGKETPTDESMFGVDDRAVKLMNELEFELNEPQSDAIYYAIKQPSLRLIQGPPGTGKTFILSCIAQIMAKVGKETAIVAKTHQAVNNALNKVKSLWPELNVCKIGQELRSDGLDDRVLNFATYKEYLAWRNASGRRKFADVVGMTLQASTVNMCLRNSGFKPEILLVDEASQIPLAEAAVIGASGAGSIIFIGDDRQMPPIVLEELENDPLSISIFEYIAKKHPNVKDVLNVTYRMNDEICSFVSENFYEPYGIELVSSESAASQRMAFDCSEQADERIGEIFGNDAPSIVSMVANDPKEDIYWMEENYDEGLFAAQIASVAMNYGISYKDIAIVTPFRKQVNIIRTALKYLQIPEEERPLVDTVERLQGQDVRLIILSFAVTDQSYYNQVKSFLLNPNRLNVMISRAKEKVVILKSNIIDFL